MPSVAVVGVGGWGKNHLRVLHQLKALKAFCDIDKNKVDLYREEYGVKGYLSMDEMLNSEHLDAVTICAPTSLHYELASKSIQKGLHTFVEKPLAYTSREGEELLRLAEKKGVTLTAGYIERFNPAVTELKEIIKEKRLGEPLLLEFHRENRWAHHVKDVGIILDTSVHDIYTARWLFESEPKVVFARTGKVITEQEDFATIILGFDEKRTASLVANWVTPKKVRKLTAVFTEGIVSIDFITQEVVIEDSQGTSIPRRKWQEPLYLELKAFIECIEKDEKPLVTPKDAVNTTKVAEAALVSSRTGSPIYLEL